jgi:hypothetical protein
MVQKRSLPLEVVHPLLPFIHIEKNKQSIQMVLGSIYQNQRSKKEGHLTYLLRVSAAKMERVSRARDPRGVTSHPVAWNE